MQSMFTIFCIVCPKSRFHFFLNHVHGHDDILCFRDVISFGAPPAVPPVDTVVLDGALDALEIRIAALEATLETPIGNS